MANEYKSPWEKPKENDELPEYLRRPANYVEPKKEAPKRDSEKEKAEWVRPNVSNLRVKAEGGKYKVMAFVDAKKTSHEISEREYNKFLALDEAHRLTLFEKVMGYEKGSTKRGPDVPELLMPMSEAGVKRGPKDEVLNIEINGRLNEVKDMKAQLDDDGKYRIWFTHSISSLGYNVSTGTEISKEQYDNYEKMSPEDRLQFMKNLLAESLQKHGKEIKSVNGWAGDVNSSIDAGRNSNPAQQQGQDKADYASMSTMNYDVAMNDSQQEQRSHGLRV